MCDLLKNICCTKKKNTTKGNKVSKNSSEDILEDYKSSKLEILPIENPLADTDLQPRLVARHGMATSSSMIAYDPLHHELALATPNGQIKVFPRMASEILFQSSSSILLLQIFYKGSLIISVNGENVIEIWDINTAQLVCSKKWGQCVTALTAIQDTTFLYIGDDAGEITTAQYDHSRRELDVLPYALTFRLMLGDSADVYDEKSVIEVLPHPIAVYEMVLICYANGICIIWGLHDRQVLAVCASRQSQIDFIIKAKNGQVRAGILSSEYNVSEPDTGSLTCVCWCCPKGSMFAAGYSNGDVYLWNIPKKHKKGDEEKFHINSSYIPICKLKGGSMIHISKLKWWKYNDNKREKNGCICVLGGKSVSASDMLKVFPLADALPLRSDRSVELFVPGDIADVCVIDSSSVIFAAVKSHHTLYIYNLKETHLTVKLELPAMVKGVRVVFPLLESRITAAKVILLYQNGTVATNLLKMPRVLSSYPYYQSSDEEQRIDSQCKGSYLYVTGHENGSVHFWDLSGQISLIRIQKSKVYKGSSTMVESEVSSLDFCHTTGFLAIGYKSGLIALYRLDAENKEPFLEGFWSFVSSFHDYEEPVSCIVISHPCRCIAATNDHGIVSLIDLEKNVLLYHGRANPNMTSAIISLNFIHLSESVTLPTALKQNLAVKTQNIVVLATKSWQIFILDAKSGICCVIPLKLKDQSECLSLHVLDASGDSLIMASGHQSQLLSETALTPKPENQLLDLQKYLILLCAEDALHVYQLSSLLKGNYSSMRIRLESPCYWASTFQTPTNRIGVVLVYRSKLMEVRGFPNLNVIRSITLENLLNFKIEPDPGVFRVLSCTANGLMILVHPDMGLQVLSLLDAKNDFRFSTSPRTAFPGKLELIKKKPLDKMLTATSFLKVRDKSSDASRCQKLQQLEQLLVTNNSTSHQSSLHSNENSDLCGDDLDVDDIEIEGENDVSSSARSSLMTKIKKKIKGKMREQREREQSLEDELNNENMVHGARSVEEIKAIYGHGRDQATKFLELQNLCCRCFDPRLPNIHNLHVAAGLRDKLFEQRQKLQAIEKRTADLQQGAENFHLMAEELNKAIQEKNKRHF